MSLEEENGLLDSIFSGWKFVPAGELRHEIAEIPEARRFAKRHDLLPSGTPEEVRAGVAPKPRPGPGPVALFRNWISYAGTGIVAVGVLVFAVLMAYHTIGGGALVQPYGDLVIFFLPPVFVFAGIAVILVGMYLQWIRWRMHKPLSFARYPKWDLNLAAERKALLSVAIGAAIISIPAIYGSGQAYVYTDAEPFCGAVCHSMIAGVHHLSTFAARPRDLRAMPRRTRRDGIPRSEDSRNDGTCRDHAERIPAANSDAHYRLAHDPGQLRGVPLAVEFLRRPRGTRRAFHVRRAEHAMGNRPVGGSRRRNANASPGDRSSLAYFEQGRICRERCRKTEHSVGALGGSQDRAWRKCTPRRRHPSAAPPAGEIRTMDCVDCHNRPTHILHSPDQSVDAALADGRIDASLPFIKQQGVASLTASYTSREQAMARNRENPLTVIIRRPTLRFTRANGKRSTAPSRTCEENYDREFLPGDEGSMGHVSHQRPPLRLGGLFPLSRRPAQEFARNRHSLRLRHLPQNSETGKDRKRAIRRRGKRIGVRSPSRHRSDHGVAAVQFMPLGRARCDRFNLPHGGTYPGMWS